MNDPIRIIHNIASLHFGGSQAFVMNLYNNINRDKIQFDFIVHKEERKDLYYQVERFGGRIFVCPKYTGKNHFAYCKWWNEFFINHPEYHVIHGHVRSTAAIYLKIAKKYGLIAIAHSHSTSNGSGVCAIVKKMMQFPIRYTADYFFACSNKAGKWLYGKKILANPNYRVILNGIDVDKFSFNQNIRENIRKRLGINENEIVIGHVGRFTKPKNHKFLIDIYAEYHKINAASKLLMIGNGELYAAIQKQCKELDILDNVIMLGECFDTENYYQAMDVFIFPSLWEGLGIALIEAQANGLPCLVSDNIPQEAILTNNVKIIKLDFTRKWIEGIADINPGTRYYIKEKLKKYDICSIAELMENFYLDIMRW